MFVASPETDFNFYFFAPTQEDKNLYDIQRSTYEFWQEIWSASLREVDQISTLYSDDYTRSNYVGVLFYKGEPVLLCLYSLHNVRLEWSRADSYFRAWPVEIFADLQRKNHSKALVCSHYTLGKKYREAGGFKVKDLVLSFIHCVFQETNYPILLATTRNSKKANQLMYSMGCEALAKDINFHGEPADLMILTKEKSFQNLMNETDIRVRDLTLSLWRTRNTNFFNETQTIKAS